MSSITLHDVARAAGVSIKTVSRVLNNERYVSDVKRRRVEAAVERLKYRPNMAARTLSGAKSYLLGFLAPAGAPMYIDRLLRGALDACKKNNYHLVAEIYDTQTDDLLDKVKALCASTALDGAVLAPGVCDSPAVLAHLRERGIPHVAISPSTSIDAPHVHIDEEGAMYAITRHLLELGHERIAFLGYQPGWKFTERRLQGFRKALEEAGVAVLAKYIGESWFTFRFAQERAEKLLALKEPPTALVAVNDETAIGAMVAAYRRGLTVPQDVSITGFDDSPLAALTWPQLTTVRQPMESMAAAAAELILKPRGAAAGEPSSVLLPFELVIRDTTRKLRSRKPSRSARGRKPHRA
ncbi:MAG TPA: LacI family DNA-binding transcriptional regulator [Steroidobacteraceae bacterium]|nr:LacI family DNA-binding transcriptional regulator [Steroidobacteraceae bacterium]